MRKAATKQIHVLVCAVAVFVLFIFALLVYRLLLIDDFFGFIVDFHDRTNYFCCDADFMF